ncbi:MAG: hypothetical protein K6E10_11425 [Eubacterium sp.]|nr:hypothetical protein [Eubacterium sp.]
MRKLFKGFVVGVVLSSMMLGTVACGSNDVAQDDSMVVEASDSESFTGKTLNANQIKISGIVYEMPISYSKVIKRLTLREEMTEKYNVKVPGNGTLSNVFLDVVGSNGSYLEVTLKNTHSDEELPKCCDISAIKAQYGKISAEEFSLPSDVSLGTSAYEITGYYGEPDTTVDGKEGFQYIYETDTLKYTFSFKKDVEGCQEILIENK